MELAEVVRRRRMVRRYAPDPVDASSVDRMLRAAVRAPSAGFSQGWAFLVLDTPSTVARFWDACRPEPSDAAGVPDRWLAGMRTAPVVVVPMSCKAAYLDRYGEPDKGWTDRAEERWPVPYWHLDTAMATLLILLTAVDEGLGACFFGIPPSRTDAFRHTFGVPADHTPIGAVTVGHPAGDPGVPGSPSRRPRRPLEDVVHHGRWGG